MQHFLWSSFLTSSACISSLCSRSFMRVLLPYLSLFLHSGAITGMQLVRCRARRRCQSACFIIVFIWVASLCRRCRMAPGRDGQNVLERIAGAATRINLISPKSYVSCRGDSCEKLGTSTLENDSSDVKNVYKLVYVDHFYLSDSY